jgi:hypothetical protein
MFVATLGLSGLAFTGISFAAGAPGVGNSRTVSSRGLSASSALVALTPAITASGVENNVAVVNKVSVANVDSKSSIVVHPGETAKGEVFCPPSKKVGGYVLAYYPIGGGYDMGGLIGASIASATASYPNNEDTGWAVVVSNPKLAVNSVSFLVRVECMEVQYISTNISVNTK